MINKMVANGAGIISAERAKQLTIIKRVGIVGCGPIGIDMALSLIEQNNNNNTNRDKDSVRVNYHVTIIEKGQGIASHISENWKHVTLFSPMKLNMSKTAMEVFSKKQKQQGSESESEVKVEVKLPNEESFLTGNEFINQYLSPVHSYLLSSNNNNNNNYYTCLFNTKVISVTRMGISKSNMKRNSPITRGFQVFIEDTVNKEEDILDFDFVIDSSGTYSNPNYIGCSGLPAIGERLLRKEKKINYYIPKFNDNDKGIDEEEEKEINEEDKDKSRCKKNKHVVIVIGSGASAITSINKVIGNKNNHVIWITRKPVDAKPYQRIDNDSLPQRDMLYKKANELALGNSDLGNIDYYSNMDIIRVQEIHQNEKDDDDNNYQFSLTLRSRESNNEKGIQNSVVVEGHEIVANVGYKPDMSITRELQILYCYASDGPMKLAASLMANAGGGGDCLAQVSGGKDTLRVPEPRFYIIGMKSYGRGSAFLMKIGYEQVENIVELIKEEMENEKNFIKEEMV